MSPRSERQQAHLERLRHRLTPSKERALDREARIHPLPNAHKEMTV